MGKRSILDPSRRAEAVMALLRREESATIIARRYGISENTLSTWRDMFLTGGKAALANGNGKRDSQSREIDRLHGEIEERDRVIGEITIANRILKKTADGLL